MKDFFKDYKEIILALVTTVFTFFLAEIKSENNQLIVTIIVIAIIVCLISYLIISRVYQNKNLSNTAVIRKSKEYTNYLSKLAKVNKRTIKKFYDKNDLVKQKVKKNKTIELVKGNNVIEKENEKCSCIKNNNQASLETYYNSKMKNYVSPEIIQARKEVEKLLNDKNHAMDIFNNIYKCIDDMKRIILQLEQHTLRIKLGKYVIACTNDIDKAINAYLDLIGWTYVLLGDNKKGIAAIEKGKELIDYALSTCEKGTDNYYKYLMLKARALRHIGTTYYTYKSADKEKVMKSTIEGIAILDKKEVYDYYISKGKINDLFKMLYGLKYNKCLFDYYNAIKNSNVTTGRLLELEKEVEIIENACESGVDIDGVHYNFDDNHRLIKVYTLKNQIKNNLYFNSEQADFKHKRAEWIPDFKKDLVFIEKILNNNVYFDEAMEVYICQKVQCLYDSIDDLFEKKDN